MAGQPPPALVQDREVTHSSGRALADVPQNLPGSRLQMLVAIADGTNARTRFNDLPCSPAAWALC